LATPSNILFLTLKVFSATGGIEKVCKVVCKGISDLGAENSFFRNFAVLSMYDGAADADKKYISPDKFKGFCQRKMAFAGSAISKGSNSKIVLLSHINLLSIGYIIKLISPKTKLVIFAHGIEVWKNLSFFKKLMLQKCDSILAVSQFTKNLMVKEHQLSADKIVVLNNCLDPFLPAPVTGGKNKNLLFQYGINDGDIVLMTLSRLSSLELYKGYDNVIISLQTLKVKYPGIKYLIVGKYDAIEKKRLDDLISDFKLEKNVLFPGYINDEDLARYYSLADLYVMPSKKEGFGIVFIEAMYYGLPVIAGNKDGSADALLNGKLGVLINPDDQQEITNAIESFIIKRDYSKPDQHLLIEHFGFNGYKKRLGIILQNLLFNTTGNEKEQVVE